MGKSAKLATFAATYFWFPKMFGRRMNEPLAQIHFWLTFVGGYAVFISMHLQGLAGHPRRYADTTAFAFLREMQWSHEYITLAAYGLAAGQLIFLINLVWSFFAGKKAAGNPWEATTLEWTVPSPPPHDNFAGVLPKVVRGAYEYGSASGERDYVMQTDEAEAKA